MRRAVAFACVLVAAASLAAPAWLGTDAAWATFSNASSAAAAVSTAALAPPTALAATGAITVVLTWTATTSTIATGTRVLRSVTAGGPYTQIAQVAGLATVSYSDTPGAGTFYYVVEAFESANGANWTSANSNEARATTPGTPSFVKDIGSASCGSGSNSVTVPAGGVVVGDTLIVAVEIRGTPVTGSVGASDSGSNTYTIDADVTNSATLRTVVLSSRLTTALTAGNVVLIVTPSTTSSSIAVAEFSHLASGKQLDNTATTTGSGDPPSAPVTAASANDLLFATVGETNNDGVIFTEASGWGTRANQSASCSGSGTNGKSALHSAYLVASTTGSYTYSPTTNNGGKWAEAIVAYKAG